MNLRTGLGVGAVALFLSASSPALADITFLPVYQDGAGEGFNDPTAGAQRKAAFEFALNIWGQQFSSAYAGETIRINAQMNPLGSGVLGAAGAVNLFSDGSTLYGSALANHLSGSDLNAGVNEIQAVFNSSFPDWYFGTDANPANDEWDFVTVVLHEVAHGLNFFSGIASNGSYSNGLPGIYDRFLEDLGGTDLVAMNDAGRNTAIRSGNLFWNGADGVAGNGGIRPEIYAPNPFEGGSSISHLDQTTHAGLMMTPGLFNGLAIHSPSDLELGMFHDMGWTAIPEPASLAVAGLFGLVALRRRRAYA